MSWWKKYIFCPVVGVLVGLFLAWAFCVLVALHDAKNAAPFLKDSVPPSWPEKP